MSKAEKNFKILVFFIVFVLSFFVLINSVSAASLGISGARFSIDGQQKFLVLASYFDGLDSPTSTADLVYLKSKGFDGVRIFPNWWNSLSPLTPDSNPLIKNDGTLDQNKLSKLISIIDIANARNMVVDISFARETAEGNCASPRDLPTFSVICREEFKVGVVEVIKALRSKTNIFYDLSNEHDYDNVIDFPQEHVVDLKNRIRSAVGNGPILSASTHSQSGSTAISQANNYGMNLVNIHYAGGTGLSANFAEAVTSNKPTYVGEPYNTRDLNSFSEQSLIASLIRAKNAGIAAWTFHTDASFNMNSSSLQIQMEANEKLFADAFRSQVDAATWGGGGGAGTGGSGSTGGVCINPAPAVSTVPNMSSVVNQVAADHPDWLQSSCSDYRFLDEIVRRLRAGTGGTKWAFEGKRANLNDPWKEGIAYYYGSGNAPQPGSMTNYEVFAIDVAHQDCANPSNITPDWIVADWPYRNPGVVQVAYLYPRNAGGSLPSPQLCGTTGGTPLQQPPPPVPTGPPTITGISPQTTAVGQTIEIFGTNLVDSVRLENLSDGKFYTVTAIVNTGATVASFEVPDLVGGMYKVSISGTQGSTISPQNLTVKSGGTPFGQPTQPLIPTEGLLGFGQLVAMIFTWSLNILGIVVFVMIFYAGFMWFTAAGNTARVNEAKERITNAITGAIILLAAYIILYTINPDLVGGTFTLPGITS